MSEKRRQEHPGRVGLLAVLVLTITCILRISFPSGPSLAQSAYSYESFHSQFDVNRDGTMRVRQRVTYSFRNPSVWVGIFIPSSYGTVTEARVLDATAEPLPDGTWERQDEENGCFLWYYSGEAGERATVVYEYTMAGALRVTGERVSLEWNGVPADRGCPVGESSVTVNLPEPVDPSSLVVEVKSENHRGRLDKRVIGNSKIIIEADGLAEDASYSFRCQWPSSIMELGGAGFQGEQPGGEAEAEGGGEPPRSWSFQDFDVELTLDADGSLIVRETHVVNFQGEFTFYNRDLPIPTEEPVEGRTYGRARIRDIAVYELDGRPYPPQSWRLEDIPEGKRVHLEFQARDETRGWVIEYRVTGVTFYASEYEGLRWTAVSSERNVPIASSTLRLRLPPGVDPEAARASLRLDPDSPPAAYESGREGDVFWWKVEGLPPHTTYSVDIVVPRGSIGVPWQYGKTCGLAVITSSAFLVLVTLAAMTFIRRRKVRGGNARKPVNLPPDGVTPAIAGLLIRERISPEEISATIVDLARRGYLSVFEEEKRTFIRRRRFGFQRVRRDAGGLLPYEKGTLEELFSGSERVTEDDLESRPHARLASSFRRGMVGEALRRELLSGDPRLVRVRYLATGSAMAAASTALLLLLPRWFDLGWFQLLLVSLIPCGALVSALGWVMPARTPRGLQALRHLEGFRDFLASAEGTVPAAASPESFEEFLPYALVLGVAEEWARGFESRLTAPPAWFRGLEPEYNLTRFADALKVMTANLGRTLNIVPGRRSARGRERRGGIGRT